MGWEAKQQEAWHQQAQEQLRQQIRLGQEAQSLMSNPVAEAWFNNGLEGMLLAGEKLVENAKTTDEELAKHLKAIVFFRRFKRFVKSTFEDGSESEKRLKQLTQASKKSLLGGLL